MDIDEYCRELEAYLCRKNDGHLIRIVGVSFERVCGWAAQGIPFKIACQGIDTYFVRYYAKGVRRRPVQIDFCEHDVLDAFDAWRRAVGVRLPGVEAASPSGAMYAFFRVAGLSDSMAFCRALVHEAKLGLAPGSAFGPEGEGFVRWCFAATDDRLDDGVARLAAFLASRSR